MASIPPSSDVWVEILKRLPPKSICRFRCVSKHWSSLLSSSFFITLHYKFSVSNTPTNQKSYFLANDYGNLEQCVVYQPQEQQLGGGVRERASFLDLPYSIDKMENEFKCICFRISGVIHGVVCLTTHENAVVWNPSIRKHISLGIGGLGVNDAAFIGFGFDAAKSDFKVVAVPYEYEYKEPFYKVYSVQDGTWRSKSFPLVSVMHSFESLPHDSIVHRPCCFVNGHIYWVMPPSGQESMCDSLLMFDCELEEFKAMALPPELVNNVRGRWPNRWRLWKHGGLLSLLAVPKPELVGQGMELWVMEEDKWTKLLTLPTDNYNALFGNDVNIMNYRCRLRLSSKDIPIRLAVYDQQPLTS